MKQRITIGQANKLSETQKQQLREWWIPAYGDFFSNGHFENIIQSAEDDSIRCVSTDNDGSYDYENKKECLPLLSIGQMIEILIDKDAFESEYGYDPMDTSGSVALYWGGKALEQELCDALWDDVKKIL